jgi:hypothetical protein
MFATLPIGVVLRASRLFLVAQLAWLVGCQHSTTPARGNGNAQISSATMRENGYGPRIEEFPVLRNRLKKLAGEAAIDCGSVGLMQEPETASACALKTHAYGKPFYVSYTWQGIDSRGAIGFAADANGNVFELDYDSAGWTSEGLPKNLQLSDQNHITTERCSKPVNLRKAGSGGVTCFLRDP